MNYCFLGLIADKFDINEVDIINAVSAHGKIIVGLFSDSLLLKLFGRLPAMPYDDRKKRLSQIRNVERIYKMNDLSVHSLLGDFDVGSLTIIAVRNYHPNDYMNFCQDFLDKISGSVCDCKIEFMNSSSFSFPHTSAYSAVETRRGILRRLFDHKKFVRAIEAHNGLTGLVAESAYWMNSEGVDDRFDILWESSLTDSTSKGKPDTSAVDFTSRLKTINEILDVTSLPMVVDLDNGGLVEHFCLNIKTLERMGVSAVIVEDKVGAKRNSLFGEDANQTQEAPHAFAAKIQTGKSALLTNEFMIIARIESLILGQGVEDALLRAKAYISAGADGIMIHSASSDTTEIQQFCRIFKKKWPDVSLISVPSAYPHVYEGELNDWGFDMVIYANHLLRAAYPQMVKCAKSILENKRCLEADEQFCMGIKDIIRLIPADPV